MSTSDGKNLTRRELRTLRTGAIAEPSAEPDAAQAPATEPTLTRRERRQRERTGAVDVSPSAPDAAEPAAPTPPAPPMPPSATKPSATKPAATKPAATKLPAAPVQAASVQAAPVQAARVQAARPLDRKPPVGESEAPDPLATPNADALGPVERAVRARRAQRDRATSAASGAADSEQVTILRETHAPATDDAVIDAEAMESGPIQTFRPRRTDARGLPSQGAAPKAPAPTSPPAAQAGDRWGSAKPAKGYDDTARVPRVAPREADAAGAFDDLLTKPADTSGRVSAGSSVVLDELPGAAALNAPVTATGELLVTRSHDLPRGFATRGAAHGTMDGREVDSALIDGELPLAASPTPVAASAAVSTSKTPGEVLRPPAPDRNHRLILTLGVIGGGLAVALLVAFGVAAMLGAFNG